MPTMCNIQPHHNQSKLSYIWKLLPGLETRYLRKHLITLRKYNSWGAIEFLEKFATQGKSALLAGLAPTAHVFRIQNGHLKTDCSQL